MPLRPCPDCGRPVSDAAPSCPGCGRPAIRSEVGYDRNVSGRTVAATLAVLATCIAAYAWLSWSHDTAPTTRAEPVTQSAPNGRLHVGGVGILRGVGNDARVFLFADRSDFDNFQAGVRAKDLAGVNTALARATIVIEGAHAREIDADAWHGAIRVRVLAGIHKDFAGWTSEGSLQQE